jgi:hypothetical protein
MKYISYVVDRDYGFAPNPFYGKCTLACCKQQIIEYAYEGDWIFGTGSKKLDCHHRLIYAMQITNKITFNEYWKNPKYKNKKPIMNGSLMQMYGDNIYYRDQTGNWFQENSHHSLDDGKTNLHNLNRDTKSEFVLISENFYYFGKKNIDIPAEIIPDICNYGVGRKYIKNKNSIDILFDILNKYPKGYIGDPIQFEKFKRHDGIKS